MKLEKSPKIEASKINKGDGVLSGTQVDANPWMSKEEADFLKEGNKVSNVIRLSNLV